MTTITRFTKEQLIERTKSVIHLAAKHPESHTARLDAAINEIALAVLTAVPAMLAECEDMLSAAPQPEDTNGE